MEPMQSIRTDADYQLALARLEVIFDAAKGSKEGGELEALSALLDQYEQAQFPIALPDPAEAAKFRSEQMGQFSS